jgi:hypothetical protein
MMAAIGLRFERHGGRPPDCLRGRPRTSLPQGARPGDPRNKVARAVCFHRLGRLRDRAVEAQQYRASGLALVTAAITLWNTVYLGRALDALRRRGETVPDARLAHLAPSGWQHINLTGDYLWAADAGLGPDGFRPLRGGASTLAEAA